jgi:2-polyprenyl-6-methoxyphenol hydroxylase-like FAD-dependent oxidoreductase
VRCRVVDPLTELPQYAKAVGVQPRTLEVFENMGVLRPILDAAIDFHGQLVYVNGARAGEIRLSLPADVPFGSSAFRSARPSASCATNSPRWVSRCSAVSR